MKYHFRLKENALAEGIGRHTEVYIVCVCVFVFVSVYVYASYMYMYVFTCVCIYMYMYVCVCIYTYRPGLEKASRECLQQVNQGWPNKNLKK